MADAPPRRRVRYSPREQAFQDAAFLRELERTGNAALAALSVGVSHGTFAHRRRTRPSFATAWDAALAVARARLDPVGGTINGEGRMVRLRSGRVQLRRHQKARVAEEKLQAFLAALSATANVALSAAAAGMATVTIYHRRRNNPGFAREMRLALEIGYRRLEEALLASYAPEAYRYDAWRHNDPPPISPMSPAQALHLLTLHRKGVERGGPDPLRRRHGESSDVHAMRLQLMADARLEQQREAYRIAEAARAGGDGSGAGEKPPVLPALDQVTGWSRASGGARRDDDEWRFGGWQRDE